jgi:hypothetical protein
MPRLTIPVETLTYIIEKAREFDAEVPPVNEDDASNPLDDEAGDTTILEGAVDNPTLEELTEALDSLNEDQQAELVALTWIGRGDFTGEDWDEALDAARERQEGGPTATYLLGTPLLSDYLEEGAAEIGYSREDLETGQP